MPLKAGQSYAFSRWFPNIFAPGREENAAGSAESRGGGRTVKARGRGNFSGTGAFLLENASINSLAAAQALNAAEATIDN